VKLNYTKSEGHTVHFARSACPMSNCSKLSN